MNIVTDNSKVIEGLEEKLSEGKELIRELVEALKALETKHAVCVRDRNHYRKLILEALEGEGND